MDFIYINRDSLSAQLCEELMSAFENSEEYHHKGVVNSGLRLDIKDTIDIKFPLFIEDCPKRKILYELNEQLYEILYSELKKYMNGFLKSCISIQHTKFHDTGFQMQKYIKGTGKFTYHNDFSISDENDSKRILTYLWYINTVEEGGETVFGDDIWIKPEAGKLVIFPCCWTYPHKGCIPISSDKYIITGWFYSNDDDFIDSPSILSK